MENSRAAKLGKVRVKDIGIDKRLRQRFLDACMYGEEMDMWHTYLSIEKYLQRRQHNVDEKRIINQSDALCCS